MFHINVIVGQNIFQLWGHTSLSHSIHPIQLSFFQPLSEYVLEF